MTRRYWTVPEISRAKRMWAAGDSISKMAKTLDRSRESINGLAKTRRVDFPCRGSEMETEKRGPLKDRGSATTEVSFECAIPSYRCPYSQSNHINLPVVKGYTPGVSA